MSSLTKVAAENYSGAANGAANLSPLLPPRPGEGVGRGVTRAEHERRLFFVAEKMLDGLSRRTLVEMAMNCFKVGRRAAQKYVALAERRLRNQEAGVSPLFYFALTKLQRDKLLECVFRQTNRPEPLEPKVLAELVTTANKVLDSRDRAAVLLFHARAAENDAPARVQVEVHALAESPKTMRESLRLQQQPRRCADRQPPGLTADEEGDDPSLAPSPEIMARMKQKISEGCTPEQAVEIVFAEVHGMGAEDKSFLPKRLQPKDWQV